MFRTRPSSFDLGWICFCLSTTREKRSKGSISWSSLWDRLHNVLNGFELIELAWFDLGNSFVRSQFPRIMFSFAWELSWSLLLSILVGVLVSWLLYWPLLIACFGGGIPSSHTGAALAFFCAAADLARGLVGQKISYLLRGNAIIAKDPGTKVQPNKKAKHPDTNNKPQPKTKPTQRKTRWYPGV